MLAHWLAHSVRQINQEKNRLPIFRIILIRKFKQHVYNQLRLVGTNLRLIFLRVYFC